MPNGPAAPNAGIALRLTIGHHRPCVREPGRSAYPSVLTMHPVLSKPLRSDRRVWLLASAVVFVILGFVDPDGRGPSELDLSPLFSTVVAMFRPSHWLGGPSGIGPPLLLRACFELLFLLLFFLAVAGASAFLGWMLQFLLTPLLPLQAQGNLDEGAVLPPPIASMSSRIGIVRVLLAGYGAGAAVFGAVVSGMNGIQFWCIWSVYDQAHRALTGFHTWSSFHDLILLSLVCYLNAAGSALLASRLTSPRLNVRLTALAILGIQLATLALSVEIFGLRTFE